jgi:C4-dicarboxylate-specific signal transduction histidine kinase
LFFNKKYTNFHEIIYDHPSLQIINKIIDFSDTELTIEIKEHHFKLSLKHVYDNNIIVLLTDVTDLVKIQHSISKSSKLKGMGTFVAGVAHEIKNPLVAVKTFTQLISKDWSNTDIQKKCKDIVLPQLHRIRNLSKSLNYFGKSEKTNYEPTNLSDLVLEVKELLMADHRYDKNIELSLNIEPNVMIFSNSTAMVQVILNLLLNALDAVQHCESPRVECHLYSDQITKAVIEIKDNGPGIDSTIKQHLFDPFFTTKDSGTGLGLSIVHQIISDHQGSVSTSNSPSAGAVFKITLPKLLRPKPQKKMTPA